MERNQSAPDPQERADSQSPESDIPAWEEIEVGRFMPRRIRGSYRGGKLG